jgi:HTH-type transcriptional regulator/antitoxin HigA
LLHSPEEARHVPRMLAECGVRFVIVERLPKAEIDGVAFWLDDKSPVIGMSVQHDRIDNFWFVLRHEIEHVLQGHGKEQEMIDVNLDTNTENISEEERIANAAAADFCVPKEKLDSFIARKSPFFYEKDVIGFAKVLHRHPGIVVGQLRKRLNRWDYLTRHLARIRQFVTPGSIVDGFGQVASVTL